MFAMSAVTGLGEHGDLASATRSAWMPPGGGTRAAPVAGPGRPGRGQG